VCDQCIADRDSKGDGMSAMILKSLVFENIDGRQIKLSEEEARQLYRELDTPTQFGYPVVIFQRKTTLKLTRHAEENT